MSLSLLVVGDIMIGEPESQPVGQADGVPAPLPLSHEADIFFGNLEVPLSDRGYPADKLVAWRSSPKLAPTLRELGFDVLGLANNHMMDYGRPALVDTINTIAETGIQTVGAGENLAEALSPVTLEHEGSRVAFLAVSCTLPLGSTAAQNRPGIAPIRVTTSYTIDPTRLQEQPGTPPYVRTWASEDDTRAVTQEIRRLKAERYLVIVSIHWGVAFKERLAEYQQPLAHSLVDAGADFIAGHHPHIIQGIEVHNGRAIFYSLSNFVIHDSLISPANALVPAEISYYWVMSRDAVAARLTTDDGQITRVEVLPVYIGVDGFGRRAVDGEAERILEHARNLSQPFNTQLDIRDGVGFPKSI